jgi:hypothetical protein
VTHWKALDRVAGEDYQVGLLLCDCRHDLAVNGPVPACVTVNRDAERAGMPGARRGSEGGGRFEPVLVRGNVMPRPASGREDQRRDEM